MPNSKPLTTNNQNKNVIAQRNKLGQVTSVVGTKKWLKRIAEQNKNEQQHPEALLEYLKKSGQI